MRNLVILIGNLGDKPKLNQANNGTAVANFSVATTENWMKDGQKESKTTWHRVNVWGKQAENCEKYLDKGSKVYIEGKIDNRSYEKDGEKKYVTEIVAREVKFLNTNKETNDALKQAHDSSAEVQSDTNFASDDIPF